MAFKSRKRQPKNICIKFALTTVESNWNNNFVINVRQSSSSAPLPSTCDANWKRAYRRASATTLPEPEPEPEPEPRPEPEPESGSGLWARVAVAHCNCLMRLITFVRRHLMFL